MVQESGDLHRHTGTPRKFKRFMEKVWDISEEDIEWFIKIDENREPILMKEQWTLSYDGTYCFGFMTSNMENLQPSATEYRRFTH